MNNEVHDDKSALLAQLAEDTRKEAEAIRAESEKGVQERRVYLEKQRERIIDDARKKAVEQAEATRNTILSGVGIEIKRNTMKFRDDIVRQVLEKARREVAGRLAGSQGRELLVAWIAEAAAGLGSAQAVVNASAPEKASIDKSMLKEAETRASAITGLPVTLSLDQNAALHEPGIVVTAQDGRTAFNNQVGTRFSRRERELRNMIMDNLFGEDYK